MSRIAAAVIVAAEAELPLTLHSMSGLPILVKLTMVTSRLLAKPFMKRLLQ